MGAGIYKDHDEAFATLKKLEIIELDRARQSEYLNAYAEWKDTLKKALG